MPQNEEYFKEALVGKKIPVLTLDHQWHKLFTQTENYEDIHRLEESLNDLLKRQGKINTELKSLSSYKKKLMQEIVTNMENEDKSEKNSKMDENKRLIEETNSKMEEYKEELLELPKKIDEVNFELMLASMKICYTKIKENIDDIDEINNWINDFRLQLKKKTLIKQKKEIQNNELYSYMHDIFGPEVIEVFDLKYNPKNVLNNNDDVNNDKAT